METFIDKIFQQLAGSAPTPTTPENRILVVGGTDIQRDEVRRSLTAHNFIPFLEGSEKAALSLLDDMAENRAAASRQHVMSGLIILELPQQTGVQHEDRLAGHVKDNLVGALGKLGIMRKDFFAVGFMGEESRPDEDRFQPARSFHFSEEDIALVGERLERYLGPQIIH